MRVSIIIPAYNAARYISETIKSVLAQTHVDFEILVVDDGSSDNTEEIVKLIDDERIKYFKQKNSGQASARNKGISESSGEFIAFIDADDLWNPQKLEEQLKVFSSNDIGLSYTGRRFIDSHSHKTGAEEPARINADLKDLIFNNFITCSSVVVRSEILKKHNFFFRDQRQGVEDWDLWLRLALVSKFAAVSKPLTSYRIHPENISKNSELMLRSYRVTMKDLKSDLETKKLFKAYNSIWHKGYAYRLLGIAREYLLNGDKKSSRELIKESFKRNPFSLKPIYWFLRSM